MNLTVNAAQAIEFLVMNIRAGLVTMLHGHPGIGKSDIVHKVCEQFKLYPIDFRAAQMDPTDVNGFGTIVKKYGEDKAVEEYIAKYVPFDVFPLEDTPIPEGYEGFCLFLDEINSAPKAVEAALYKVILDRMMGQKKLHPRTAIICAGNLVTSGAIVNRQGTAMQSRLIHLELAVDPIAWVKWAGEHDLDFRVISYISAMPKMLHEFDPKHQDKAFACPRTWEFVSKILKVAGKRPLTEIMTNLAGTIGEGMARQFVVFSETLAELATIEEILANPKTAKLSDKPSLRHAASHLVAAHLNADNVKKLMVYIKRMPVEFQTLTLQGAIGRNRELIYDDEIIEWVNDNGDLLQ